MEHRKLGHSTLTVSALGLGCMSMSGTYGKSDDAQSIAVIHRALDLGDDPARLLRHVRVGAQRGAGRACAPGTASQRGPGNQVRPGAESRRGQPGRRAAGARPPGVRREPPAPGRRRDRPLLPASGRSQGADRGHGGRHGPADRAGEGAVPRPVRGRARDDPARARGASDRRRPARVLAALPAAGRGGAPDLPRARDHARGVLTARARIPLGPVSRARPRFPRTTGSASTPASRGRTSTTTAGSSAGSRRSRARRASRRPSSSWRGSSPRGTTSSRSPAPSGSRISRRTWGRSVSGCPPTTSGASTRPCPPAQQRVGVTPTRSSAASTCSGGTELRPDHEAALLRRVAERLTTGELVDALINSFGQNSRVATVVDDIFAVCAPGRRLFAPGSCPWREPWSKW